jgi:two-component system sensor histidine kinase CreC
MRTQLEGKQFVERYVQELTHEMKSPLAAIRASAELLEQPLAADDQARFAGAIGAQSERLAQMVDRLLSLAAVEHRQRLESPQTVEVADLLADVVDDCRANFESRALTLSLRVDGSPCVRGDPFLLRQALDNLVDNAASFAPASSAVEIEASSADGFAVIRVSDRGPGIPDYALPRVFERFYSLPRPDSGQRGSGLGLCFVAQVADLHGGSATLENRPGAGACATLRLPVAGTG